MCSDWFCVPSPLSLFLAMEVKIFRIIHMDNALIFERHLAYVIFYCIISIHHLRGKFFGQGSFTSTGLVVSSKLPRFSDLYTLTVASADPKSISAGQPVEFTKSVTEWSLTLYLTHIHTSWIFYIMDSHCYMELYIHALLYILQVRQRWSSGGGLILERCSRTP